MVGVKKDIPNIKIADFGIATALETGVTFRKFAGTIFFMSPEMCQMKASDFKTDIWSLGVILYALICSRVPFNGEGHDAIAQEIVNAVLSFDSEPWSEVSDDCKDLITRLLDKNPKTRITIADVLKHSWTVQSS